MMVTINFLVLMSKLSPCCNLSITEIEFECEYCEGSGIDSWDDEDCSQCSGTGLIDNMYKCDECGGFSHEDDLI